EAASLALAALAPHLPRYQRSVSNYARLLLGEEDEESSVTREDDPHRMG
ncbi:MAG: tetratricopeptide repeat protein, partial [Chloroflexi bacterium]|nr:tetratricopeptide repeat protein [Chloroflexota bacterium]